MTLLFDVSKAVLFDPETEARVAWMIFISGALGKCRPRLNPRATLPFTRKLCLTIGPASQMPLQQYAVHKKNRRHEYQTPRGERPWSDDTAQRAHPNPER
jgi:hypothetical protein